jgi:hypothetical protein
MKKSNDIQRNLEPLCRKTICLFPKLLVTFLALFISASIAWGVESNKKNTSTIGSGEKYTTTVERQTKGELAAEDFRQVSTLGSQIIGHLNNATDNLEDNKPDKAKTELDKAETLFKVIRDMLPETTVTTVVKDAKGNTVYRTTEIVQEDLVPIYESMTAVDVVQPIEDAKKREETLKGLRLTDAEVIQTSVLLDLGYVERKIKRAQSLMTKEIKQAFDELLLAQTNGIRFSIAKQDSPLVKAQRALRLAERMVNEKKIEGAESNLRVAKFHLETYKTLVDEKREKEVETLQKDIDRLFGTLEQKESESKVRRLWSRVTDWFSREPGQSHQTTPTTE